MERRQAEAILDLPRGTFLALGPAVSRRPLSVAIGEVETSARSMSPKLVPLPTAKSENLQGLLFDVGPEEGGSRVKPGMTDQGSAGPSDIVTPDLIRGPPTPLPSESLLEQLAAKRATPAPTLPTKSEEEQAEAIAAVLQAMISDPDASGRSPANLHPDPSSPPRRRGTEAPPRGPPTPPPRERGGTSRTHRRRPPGHDLRPGRQRTLRRHPLPGL